MSCEVDVEPIDARSRSPCSRPLVSTVRAGEEAVGVLCRGRRGSSRTGCSVKVFYQIRMPPETRTETGEMRRGKKGATRGKLGEKEGSRKREQKMMWRAEGRDALRNSRRATGEGMLTACPPTQTSFLLADGGSGAVDRFRETRLEALGRERVQPARVHPTSNGEHPTATSSNKKRYTH